MRALGQARLTRRRTHLRQCDDLCRAPRHVGRRPIRLESLHHARHTLGATATGSGSGSGFATTGGAADAFPISEPAAADLSAAETWAQLRV